MKTPPGDYTFVVTAEQRKTADKYQFDMAAVCIPMVSSTGHGHASIHRIYYEEGKFRRITMNKKVRVSLRNVNCYAAAS